MRRKPTANMGFASGGLVVKIINFITIFECSLRSTKTFVSSDRPNAKPKNVMVHLKDNQQND
jgi:hypothetical protein